MNKPAFYVFCAAVAAIFAFCFWGNGTDGEHTIHITPATLNGTWHQSSDDSSPVNMTAEITDNHIRIMMDSNTISGLYWDGTFESNPVATTFEVASATDSNELSQDSVKTFTYKNGELSYPFSMMGKTYTIRLIRGE